MDWPHHGTEVRWDCPTSRGGGTVDCPHHGGRYGGLATSRNGGGQTGAGDRLTETDRREAPDWPLGLVMWGEGAGREGIPVQTGLRPQRRLESRTEGSRG